MDKATCSVEGCERAHYGRSWCKAHYARVSTNGSPQEWKPLRPLPTAAERDDIIARIMQKTVRLDSGCIEWTGTKNKDGYGQISWRARGWRVHRAIWTEMVGPIPDELTIDHLCRNRACVNVGHMETVPQAVNADRGGGLYVANTNRRSKIECVHGHDLADAIKLKTGARLCRTCSRERWVKKSASINARRRAQSSRMNSTGGRLAASVASSQDTVATT